MDADLGGHRPDDGDLVSDLGRVFKVVGDLEISFGADCFAGAF
jgi:hypothetical protein